MDKDKKAGDVQDVVDPTKVNKDVDPNKGGGDDKDKNFAALRTKVEALEKEKADLQKQLSEKDDKDRSLSIGEDDGGEKQEDKTPKKDPSEPIKVIFQRDMKEATIQWNKKNKVSKEEWAEIKKKVALKGDETQSEIFDKIDEAYQSLPSVRERRDKEQFEKGKKQAMSQFQDDELDLGGGGDVDLGGGNSEPHFNSKEKKFLDSFGVSSEERKKIDKGARTNEWQEGKSPRRAFFDGAKR